MAFKLVIFYKSTKQIRDDLGKSDDFTWTDSIMNLTSALKKTLSKDIFIAL